MRHLYFIALFLISFLAKSQTTIYVDSNATGANNGTSWINAFKHLQDALGASTTNDTICVAQGTYYPDLGIGFTNNDRSHYFNVPDSVKLFGGFNGTETLVSQRNWTLNKTILSGEIQQDNDSTNNTYNIVVINHNNYSSQTYIDGFTIKNGFNTTGNIIVSGAGIAIVNCSASLNNLIIENNYNQGFYGGGLNCLGMLKIKNCTFRNNASGGSGGAIQHTVRGSGSFRQSEYDSLTIINNTAAIGGGITIGIGSSNLYDPTTITNCTFLNNYAQQISSNSPKGSALYTTESIIMGNCTFKHNYHTDTEKGTIYFDNIPSSPSTLINNCKLDSNGSFNFPGCTGMYIENSSPIITNTYFTDNDLSNYDAFNGLIYNTAGSNPQFINVKFEQSYPIGFPNSGPMVYNNSSNPTFTNCGFYSNHTTFLMTNQNNSSPTIANSVYINPNFNNAPPNIRNYSSSSVVINNSYLQGENPSGLGNINATITTNPGLVNFSGNDYHLLKNSPLHNAGNVSLLPNDLTDLDSDMNTTETLPLDAEFNKRISACSVDIGPYEYQSDYLQGVTNDTSLCYTGSVSLYGIGDSLQWYSDITLNNLVASGDTLIENGNAATYTYYVTDSTFNCPKQISDTVTLTINALPTPNLGMDTVFCAGDSIQLNGGTFTSYLWNTSETTQSIFASVGGSYHLMVNDSNGCNNSDTVLITQNTLPNPNLGVDTTICSTSSILLSPGTFNVYNWNNSTTNPTLLVDGNVTGTGNFNYYVTVTDTNGCMNTDSVTVNVSICTGIDNYGNAYEITAYPNPTNGNLTVNLGNYIGNGTITILNSIGSIVNQNTFVGNNINLEIDKPKGFYFVKIETLQFKKTIRIILK